MRMKDRKYADFLIDNYDNMANIYFKFIQLKNLFRQGWIKAGVSEKICESVAEHVFSTMVLSLLIIKKLSISLDLEKVLTMILFHETGEILTGDFTPDDDISENEKREKEKEAIIKVVGKNEDLAFILDIWNEFEDNKTKEAKFVKQMDKLDMFFQLKAYEDYTKKELYEKFKKSSDLIYWKELKKEINKLFS